MFQSKHYPAVMYVCIILVLLMIFFSFTDIFNKTNAKITGNAIKTNETNKTSEIKPKTEIRSAKPYWMFYFVIIGVIALLLFIAISLRSTIITSIKKEDQENKDKFGFDEF